MYRQSTYERICDYVRSIDPLLVAAAEDVDHDLVAWFSTLTIDERLKAATSSAGALDELRANADVASQAR